jgi:SAM-dependent methyltransferase
VPSVDQEILEEIGRALHERRLVAGTFSDRGQSGDETPRRQQVRPVTIRGENLYQWSSRFERKETHENLTAEQSLARIATLLDGVYRQAQLSTDAGELHLRRDRTGWHVARKGGTRVAVETDHNRRKNYLIPEGVPCPFLIAQGVMRPDGRVVASLHHKFRQVNRFLEFVNDIYPALPAEGTIHVVDYGCGKSYLTFAVHHLLTAIHRRDVRIIGLDRNADVIATCRKTAEDLTLEGIAFESTSIAEAGDESPLDLAIALHACDTATDHALADAVRRGAGVILAAPCCQHEVAAHMQAASLPLLASQGIVKERLAALATDSLRAAALEAAGYKTQVIEFIETDHTPKNLLLRSIARRAGEPIAPKWAEQYGEMKQTLGLGPIAVDQILDAAEARRGANRSVEEVAVEG